MDESIRLPPPVDATSLRPRDRSHHHAVGVLAAVIVALTLAGCGGSVEGKVADALGGVKAECVKAGVREIAAQRETIYRCQLPALVRGSGKPVSVCVAIIDGSAYAIDTSNRVRELSATSLDSPGC